jgi:hypothetical protein
VQFEVLLDGKRQFVASVAGEGHLGVHINTKPAESNGTLDVSGYEVVSGAETLFLKWPSAALTVGQSITVRCVEGQAADTPSSQRSSKNDSRICILSSEVAADLHARVQAIERELLAFLPIVEAAESPESSSKFRRAIGTILSDLSDNFLGPLYNAHPHLRPTELRGVPL